MIDAYAATFRSRAWRWFMFRRCNVCGRLVAPHLRDCSRVLRRVTSRSASRVTPCSVEPDGRRWHGSIMKTNQSDAPPVMKHDVKTDAQPLSPLEHANPSPIGPAPTTERDAARIAENAGKQPNETPGINPNVHPNVDNRGVRAPLQVDPKTGQPVDPRAVPPVVHGGPGVAHIPGTDIVVGGPTQQ